MKSGIIKRIDPLGRIVIPKKIRQNLHLHDGDPLELSLDGNNIVLTPYSPLSGRKEQSEAFLRIITRELGLAAAVCDRDRVICCCGASLLGSTGLSPAVQRRIQEQSVYRYDARQAICLTAAGTVLLNALFPLGSRENPAGALALIRKDDRNLTPAQMDTAMMTAQILTAFIKY